MAERRYIVCVFCTPQTELPVPEAWSTDYAMGWYRSTHLAEHVEQMIACQPCVAAMWSTEPHTPCFDADCNCACSYTTTTPAREDRPC